MITGTAKFNALGDFLRARRDQVRPEEVGLVPGARRRAPGLRREELAMLAGISVEYYLRLERGRAHNPSPQILEALARALQLDRNATQHLRDLAGPTGPDTSDSEAGAHALADVIDQFSMPAIVANRYQDVLAANPIARALSPEFTPRQSFLRWRVLNPAARKLYVDWDEATASAVGGLRDLAGPCPNDPRMRALITEMSAASARFRELWCRGEVGYRTGIDHMRHPQIGELYLYRSRLNAPYPGGQHVLTWRAEPGSDSAEALEELRSLSMHQRYDLAAV
jgi:transcriptional regulator with XRE-family HTH domain